MLPNVSRPVGVKPIQIYTSAQMNMGTPQSMREGSNF